MSSHQIGAVRRPSRLVRPPHSESRNLAYYRTDGRTHCSSAVAPSRLLDLGTLQLSCPRFAHREVSDRPAYCARLTCPVCVRINAFKVARAIALAAPTTSYRLSLVGDSWGEIQPRMRQVVRRLRNEIITFEHVWHVESNPGGTGNHIHGWSWGARPSMPLLSDAAFRAGMGENVDVRRWITRQSEDPMIAYGMKGALAESSRTALSPATKDFLALNGGRLVHASRSFYRDGAGGPQLRTRREAERRASQRARRCTAKGAAA